MRLRKIAQILQECYPKLAFDGSQLSPHNWRLQGAAGVVSAAEQIRRTKPPLSPGVTPSLFE